MSCACGMRYRSTDARESHACICGQPLVVDQRETLRRLILESDAPLEVLIERVRSLTDQPEPGQAFSPRDMG